MKFKVTTYDFQESRFENQEKEVWLATSLYDAARKQKCKKFKLPMKHINLEWRRFGDMDLYDFSHHMKRVNNADLEQPIIMSCYGQIMDGAHRIIKAVIEEKEFVWCLRLKESVKPDYCNNGC